LVADAVTHSGWLNRGDTDETCHETPKGEVMKREVMGTSEMTVPWAK